MDNPFLVRRRESPRDLQREINSLALGESLASHSLTQSFAIQEFRDYVMGAIVFANVVNCDDIRMIQRACGAGFLLKAMQPLLIVGE